MVSSECQKLTDRFTAMKDQGLVDVKFLLRNTDEAIVEQVCREVNDMLNAYDRGEHEELKFNDSNQARG